MFARLFTLAPLVFMVSFSTLMAAFPAPSSFATGTADAAPPMDRDGDGHIGEESAIKERILAYIERHGKDGKISSRDMLERSRWSYDQWLKQKRDVSTKAIEGEDWVNIGPVNGAGRTTRIAPHPTLDGVVLQGAASGGVWKTLDDGNTWYPTTDGLSDLSVGALAWAPSSTDVVYVGTGEGDTLIAGGSGYIPGIGLLRSDDGGESWIIPGGEEDPVADLFFALDVDPDNDEIVTAATERGLLRTEDGGVTWQTLLPREAGSYAYTEVLRSAGDPSLMYAAQWCEGFCPTGTGRVMLSTDRGVTWAPVGGIGLPGLTGYVNRAALALAPSNDRVLYLATNTTDGQSGTPLASVFRSEDGGETWSETALSSTRGAKDYLGFQGWYDNTIIVNPNDPNVVIAGGIWYVKTVDGGQTWTNQNPYNSGGGMGSATVPHVDVHDLEYQGNSLWVGNDGGVWVSEDDGATWSARNDGVVTRQYYGMAVDPVNRERVLGGTQDNGTNLRNDSGDDTFRLVLGGDGFDCAINPLFPETYYATVYYTSIYRRSPPFYSFTNISPPFGDEDAPFITPLTMHSADPNVLFTGTTRLWRSDNGGDSWYGLPVDPSTDVSGAWIDTRVWAIATTPADPDRIVMSKGPAIYTSSDGGLTWVMARVVRTALNVAISPHDPDLALAAMESGSDSIGGVRRTTDGGLTWTTSGTGLPPFNVQVVRFDPTDPAVAYAGTDVGLYRSLDGGVTWERYGNGLPAVSIHDLRILPDGSMLRVGTYGRGFWELAIPRPSNQPPTVAITTPDSTSTSATANSKFDFVATATDPDGDEVRIDWYFTTDFSNLSSDAGTGSVTSSIAPVIESAGIYNIVARATDAVGAQAVDWVSLRVREPADKCDAARVLPGAGPFPFSILTSNGLASKDDSDPVVPCVNLDGSDPDSGREGSIWFEFTPTKSATYTISTCGSAADTLISLWTGDACGPFTQVGNGCNDDDDQQHCMGPRTDSYLAVDLEAETTYRIMVGSWKSEDGAIVRGQFRLNLDCRTCTAGQAEDVTVVAAAASAPGADGTVWETDLSLYNPASEAVEVGITFLRENTDNAAATEHTTTVPPGAVRSLRNVVGDFLDSEGSGAIRLAGGAGLVVGSRTFNRADDSTFGQFIPGVGLDRAIPPGGEGRLIGLAGNDKSRTNLGLVNVSDAGATVSIDLFTSDGILISHLEETLLPWAWKQLNRVFAGFDSPGVKAATALVRNTSSDSQVLFYASIVDAATGDPTFVTGVETAAAYDPLWVAASAHDDGVGLSAWRSDLNLFNAAATGLTATVELLESETDNSSASSRQFSIPAGEGLEIGDIVGESFGFTGAASLRIRADRAGISATSRTFNQTTLGTFGQFIPAVGDDASISKDQTAVLTLLRQDQKFRFNVGLANLGPDPIRVRADFFAPDGIYLRTKEYDVPPLGHLQDGGALPRNVEIDGGYSLLTTETEGGRFLAYASVVDNVSDDPIYVPARILAQ